MRARFVAQQCRRLCSSTSQESSTRTGIVEALASVSKTSSAQVPAVERPQDNPSYIPWTPTDRLSKKKTYFKRMAFLIDTLEKEQEAVAQTNRPTPKFNTGDTLKLTLRLPENQNKETEYTGICIAKKNKGYRSSFIVRKTWPPSQGVERTFPLCGYVLVYMNHCDCQCDWCRYCPTILKIEVIAEKRHNKAKLYHLRENTKATAV